MEYLSVEAVIFKRKDAKAQSFPKGEPCALASLRLNIPACPHYKPVEVATDEISGHFTDI